MDAHRTRFGDICLPALSLEDLEGTYAELLDRVQRADSTSTLSPAIESWNELRQSLETRATIVRARFSQDTRDEERRSELEAVNAMAPRITELDVRLKHALLDSPHRPGLEARLGRTVFDLWEVEVAAFEPAIADDLKRESALTTRYTELTGSAKFPFRGAELTLPALLKYSRDSDRATRREAETARWGWFERNADELDSLFDELVTVRTRMANTLGETTYTPLGYRLRRRTDYGPDEVAAFRAAVREEAVPFATELRAQQARALGLGRLMLWDERVYEPGDSPAPQGGREWMIARAGEMFDAMGPAFGELYASMVARDMLDLESRPGKGPGGFMTWLHTYRTPFVFANFNGTHHDVRVFTHEMGHAFQRHSSRDLFPIDYVRCTSETAEIHSMALEFLTWPEMERFFGERAGDFRRTHLRETVLMLPYLAAIDHFQHLVYANPAASAVDRNEMWLEMERLYQPERDAGDLRHPARGGLWQSQLHVYLYPFYYIDYALASTCALQLWARSRGDHAGAMESYVALCEKGGTLPFRAVLGTVGLESPFAEGCLARVLKGARDYLA